MSDRISSERQSAGDAASLADPHHITDSAPEPSSRKAETSVHPATIGVALAAALWFIAVTWVSFARGAEVDWDLVVVTLFFIFFFALFLFTASYGLKDQMATARHQLPRVPGQRRGHGHGADAGPRRAARGRRDPGLARIHRDQIGLVWIALH